MRVGTVCEMLEALGSGDDSIWYRGKETTPSELNNFQYADMEATKLRITYYGMKGKELTKIVGGTLTGMLKDRMATA